MRDIESIIVQIIPPPTREEREGFTNDTIISSLSQDELLEVEKRLIQKLKFNDDLLIAQTLVNINSQAAYPMLLRHLHQKKSNFDLVIWAALIHDLKNGDTQMEKIAYEAFQKLEFIYAIQGDIFNDLNKFNSFRINKRIEKFVDHKYFLVSHHARMVLNYKGYFDLYSNKVSEE
ncbi:MAG: hypothetical protein WBA16_10700 [Nonlabens sp.]